MGAYYINRLLYAYRNHAFPAGFSGSRPAALLQTCTAGRIGYRVAGLSTHPSPPADKIGHPYTRHSAAAGPGLPDQ